METCQVSNDQPVCETGQPLTIWEARVKELVRQVIREEGSQVPLHVREENHRFVENCRSELQAFLAERQRARERMERIRTTVIGGLLLSAALSIASALWWLGNYALHMLASQAAQEAAQHADKLPKP
jgi:hypothetical protein